MYFLHSLILGMGIALSQPTDSSAAVLTSATNSASDCYRATLTGDAVNLRSAPQVTASGEASGKRGERFRVRSADGDWAEIMDGPHRGHFVSQRFLSLQFISDSTKCAHVQGPGEVRGDRVNLRSAPNLSAPKSGQAFRGDPLTVMPGPSRWMKILWPEVWANRYIHSNFVNLVLPAGADTEEADAELPAASTEVRKH